MTVPKLLSKMISIVRSDPGTDTGVLLNFIQCEINIRNLKASRVRGSHASLASLIQEQRDADKTVTEIRSRHRVVKILMSTDHKTAALNKEQAALVIEVLKADSFYKDECVIADRVHTVGFMNACLEGLELLSSVDDATRTWFLSLSSHFRCRARLRSTTRRSCLQKTWLQQLCRVHHSTLL